MPLLIHSAGSGGGGGVYVGPSPPSNTEMLWIDVGNNSIPKYFDGTAWTPLKAVWG